MNKNDAWILHMILLASQTFDSFLLLPFTSTWVLSRVAKDQRKAVVTVNIRKGIFMMIDFQQWLISNTTSELSLTVADWDGLMDYWIAG